MILCGWVIFNWSEFGTSKVLMAMVFCVMAMPIISFGLDLPVLSVELQSEQMIFHNGSEAQTISYKHMTAIKLIWTRGKTPVQHIIIDVQDGEDIRILAPLRHHEQLKTELARRTGLNPQIGHYERWPT